VVPCGTEVASCPGALYRAARAATASFFVAREGGVCGRDGDWANCICIPRAESALGVDQVVARPEKRHWDCVTRAILSLGRRGREVHAIPQAAVSTALEGAESLPFHQSARLAVKLVPKRHGNVTEAGGPEWFAASGQSEFRESDEASFACRTAEASRRWPISTQYFLPLWQNILLNRRSSPLLKYLCLDKLSYSIEE
jgi:hypothetical protein